MFRATSVNKHAGILIGSLFLLSVGMPAVTHGGYSQGKYGYSQGTYYGQGTYITAPSAPTSLNATGGTVDISLTWVTPSSNGGSAITGYKIYRDTSPSPTTLYTNVGVVNSYVDSSVTQGTIYYYRVKATNAAGDSVYSNEDNATALNVPGAPTNVDAVGSATNIELTWSTPVSNGGSAITGYKIYRSTSPSPTTLYASVGVVNNYTDSAVTQGTLYYYRVKATNAIGDSAYSSEDSASAQDVPGAPTALNATVSGVNIGLTWSTPASSGGSAITGYKIYRGTSASPTSLYATVGVTNSYTDTAAQMGQIYYYRVKATNAIGDSAYSNEDNDTVPCASGGSGGNITGWGWSDTIGWISLNSADSGTCTSATYGLTLDGSGNITGYAWGQNIGWIQFGGLSSFPSGEGTVAVNAQLQGNNVVGWARAIAYADTYAGGWDGWISLHGSGTDVVTLQPFTYGVSSSGNALLGWAWGDTSVGWISFSANYACADTSGYYCTDNVRHYQDLSCNVDALPGLPETCAWICSSGSCVAPPNPSGTLDGSGTAISATPVFVRMGGRVQITWGTEDTVSCTVTGSNGDGPGAPWNTLSGSQQTAPITKQTTYTLDCDGNGGTSLNQSVTVRVAPTFREL